MTGHFGNFGGRFVPETLVAALEELEAVYMESRQNRAFQNELNDYLKHYAGRPTPLFYAERLSKKLGGPKIYLKREDLTHTGSHKINNTLGQCLLAKRIGSFASLRRQALGSTEWPRLQRQRSWDWNAKSTWGKKTFGARLSMFSA